MNTLAILICGIIMPIWVFGQNENACDKFKCYQEKVNGKTQINCSDPKSVTTKQLISCKVDNKKDAVILELFKTNKPVDKINSNAFKVIKKELPKIKMLKINFQFKSMTKKTIEPLKDITNFQLSMYPPKDKFDESIFKNTASKWSSIEFDCSTEIFTYSSKIIMKSADSYKVSFDKCKQNIKCYKGACDKKTFISEAKTIEFTKMDKDSSKKTIDIESKDCKIKIECAKESDILNEDEGVELDMSSDSGGSKSMDETEKEKPVEKSKKAEKKDRSKTSETNKENPVSKLSKEAINKGSNAINKISEKIKGSIIKGKSTQKYSVYCIMISIFTIIILLKF